jgi:hypothetical protein
MEVILFLTQLPQLVVVAAEHIWQTAPLEVPEEEEDEMGEQVLEAQELLDKATQVGPLVVLSMLPLAEAAAQEQLGITVVHQTTQQELGIYLAVVMDLIGNH